MHQVLPIMSRNTLVDGRNGHGSLNNHTLLKTTITPIVCAKRNDQKARAQERKVEKGEDRDREERKRRRGDEKRDSSVRLRGAWQMQRPDQPKPSCLPFLRPQSLAEIPIVGSCSSIWYNLY